jgi:small subunit ribosomal protein S15
MDKKFKDKIIKKYRTHESDTGSSEVQIALLSEEIKQLTGHLKNHAKDFSSRRGLIRKVNERRRLLRYLEQEDKKRFDILVDKLKLKIAKKLAVKRAEAEAERLAMEEAKLALEVAKEEENEIEQEPVSQN